MLLHHCPLSKAKEIAEALRQSIQEVRFTWQNKVFTIGSSIGVAAIDETSSELASILNAADAACYVAKERGRNSVHVFQNNDRELARQRDERQWIFRLKQALEENRFCLYGQQIIPIIPGLGKVHYEVLLRMVDEDGNLVPPMAFIPAAERFGLMPRSIAGSSAPFLSILLTGRNRYLTRFRNRLGCTPSICRVPVLATISSSAI